MSSGEARRERWTKRLFDLSVALAGLLVLWPLLVVIAVLVRASSVGPALFVQARVGRHGRLFRCAKFRTMRLGADRQGSVTTGNDPRVTPVGRLLRRTKLDELPQLWHVLVGKMSFVGPRPDVPGYADRLCGDEREILDLRPGITGPATLLFRGEETLLTLAKDPRAFNDEVVYREKVRINLEYSRNWSLLRDLGYVGATLAPSISRRTGLDRLLGLDVVGFRQRMEEAASRYQTRASLEPEVRAPGRGDPG